MTAAPAALLRRRLATALVVTLGLLVLAASATALDFTRAENVGGLHLHIPIDYLAGGHDDSEFLLAVRWPSLAPLAGSGMPALGRDTLLIAGDEDQPASFETLRRYVGAAPKPTGERSGLQIFPRDAAFSQGHYDPHLELFVHVEDGEVRSVITCAADFSTLAPICHDEFIFRRAHITLSFDKALLDNWRAMEARSLQLLLSFQ